MGPARKKLARPKGRESDSSQSRALLGANDYSDQSFGPEPLLLFRYRPKGPRIR
jgi:hypothetical protein